MVVPFLILPFSVLIAVVGCSRQLELNKLQQSQNIFTNYIIKYSSMIPEGTVQLH